MVVGLLIAVLIVSILLNVFQYYRWHSYRSQSAGVHSYTGMQPAVRVTDKKRRK